MNYTKDDFLVAVLRGDHSTFTWTFKNGYPQRVTTTFEKWETHMRMKEMRAKEFSDWVKEWN